MPATTPDKPHAGRIALVTGAARGIGQAIAVGLARQGATVVIGDVGDLAETSDLIARLAIRPCPHPWTSATRPSSIACASESQTSSGESISWSTTPPSSNPRSGMTSTSNLRQRIMAVNLNGPMLMCKAFLPLMRCGGWGRIINMASATVAIASPVSIAYRTSKMAVIGFTRALSATLGDDGITVNVVLPSLTRTAMSEGLPEAVVNNSLSRQVIHRMAEPDDIAGSVLILAADQAGWITGQAIMANGGNSFGL
jgi:NAD(P)-dependent dehydrogenase (short-subunit alcohol dehydrogenase family)